MKQATGRCGSRCRRGSAATFLVRRVAKQVPPQFVGVTAEKTSRETHLARRIKSRIEIMNLLNITAVYSRDASFVLPVRRKMLRRERKNRRKRVRHNFYRHLLHTQQVRLEFFDPQAREVNIAGSFNDWRPGATWMISLGNGRWVKELLLPPGRHEYAFVVDGHWLPDPRAVQSTSAPRGSYNSVLIVPHPNGNGHSRHFVLQPQRKHVPHSYGQLRKLEKLI